MLANFNNSRVIHGKKNNINILPVFAWQLDNNRKIDSNEIRINAKMIQLEASSFKKISVECNGEKNMMKERILEIVNVRGKLHNPYTDTGGTLAGNIEKIGAKYKNSQGLKPGDEIVALVSTTSIPLHIERILEIDFQFSSIEIEGYAILSDDVILVKKPDEIGLHSLLMVFDESASFLKVYQLAKGGKRFLVIGSNPIVCYLYGCTIRKAIGNEGVIVGFICDYYFDDKIGDLLKKTFDEVYYRNSMGYIGCAELVLEKQKGIFDLSINCSEEIQAEAVNILVTKENGTVFLSNMLSHYSMAALLMESLKKDLNILGCAGYIKNYEEFSLKLTKDISEDIERIAEIQKSQINRKIERYTPDVKESDTEEIDKMVLYDFIYESSAMEKTVKEISKAAKYDSSVLIMGESGTGKEKIADILHGNSKRMMEPCIKVNCASIPENLMESEFFGYDKGAFTGASATGKAGYFELADKGTLFLDEISEMPLDQQAKLLRVLQDKKYYRVGGVQPVYTDFRIIAASNKNLKDLVDEGLFREDLYYRIAVLILYIPPLRNRTDDIIPIAKYFLNKYNKMYYTKKALGNEALDVFLNYNWPGNIREMDNLIQRVMVNSEGDMIAGEMVITEMNRDKSRKNGKKFEYKNGLPYKEFINKQEREYIQASLLKYGTTRKAAEALGITQSQFMRKKKKHNL